MKVRTDFVTNSSSSSYIIAYQQTPNYDEATLKKYPALDCFNRLIDIVLSASSDYNETDASHKITTKEELNNFFVDSCGWADHTLDDILSDDEYLKERYDKCIDAIQRGYVVLFKEVSYYDDTLADLIRELGNGNVGVEIIDQG